jgi:hypothetical protein
MALKPMASSAWVPAAIEAFVDWLDRYGETSFDHQTFYAGPLGGRAKAVYYRRPVGGLAAVAPLVFFEAFVPSARRFFWKKQRFPIADAHYAMGFALLALASGEKRYREKAIHFLQVLRETRCPGFEHLAWGYPFDWVTRNGTIPTGTPLITTTPYVYEAFSYVQQLEPRDEWRETLRSIASHAAEDFRDFEIGPDMATCSYTPSDQGGVINASAYRAFLLTKASRDFSEPRYWDLAQRNINFVLQYQRPDGSWYYSIEGERDFIDHFHTCFILKALAKIVHLTGHDGCSQAIQKGLLFYQERLFEYGGLPKPFATAPRLTVYRHELYDYAECLNLCLLLKNQFEPLRETQALLLEDLHRRWIKPDGSFRSRQLLLGWDNIPMHRWAQSQIFRSLCLLVYEQACGQVIV